MTSSSEVEERPRDALCPSVVILNKIITRAESLITVSYRLQIYLCVMLFLVFWGFLSYTSSFFPAINKRGRLPVTSVINSSLSVAAKCIALAAGTVHNTVKPDIGSESDFCVPHLHSTLPLGGGVPSEYCHAVWYRKTRIVWLPDGQKIWKYVYSFWQNPRTWRTDIRENRHRMMAKAALA